MPGPLGTVGRDRPDVAVLRPRAPRLDPMGDDDDAPPSRHELGDRIADAAQHYLDHTPRGFRDDCSGFVMAALDRAGSPTSGSALHMWEAARSNGATHGRKRPRVGDLAFFDNTYDRNRNGRWDDEVTHIGIVIDVDKRGTVTIAHAGTSKGRTTMKMNLYDPDLRRDDDGEVLNDFLRSRKSSDPDDAPLLSGQLWRGFATLDGDGLVSP